MGELHEALDAAHRLAVGWLDSLPERRVPPSATTVRDHGSAGRPARASASGPGGDRAARVRGGTRADGHPVRPLVRHGDGRHAAGGPRRRLAHQRLGPEQRVARGHAGARSPSRNWPTSGCSTCSACPPTAGSAWPPVRRWRTSPALAAARDDVLRQAGWDAKHAAAWSAPRASGCSSATSATTPSTSCCGTSASACPNRWTPTSRAASTWTRCAPPCARATGPTIVVLQAGNVHSGAFDDFTGAIAVAHEHGRLGARRRGVRPVRRRVLNAAGTSPPASTRPTPGRPTRTRRSTCPTTAASRSCATGRRCAPSWACTATT